MNILEQKLKEQNIVLIIGIVLSSLGLIQMVYNIINPNQEVVNKINEIFEQYK